MKRADATATDWIGGDVERLPETDCFGTVENLMQRCAGADPADRGMEEARANVAGGIDNSGYPGRVTSRRIGLVLSERDDAAEFIGCFEDESTAFPGSDHAVDFAGEFGDIGLSKAQVREVGIR